MKRRPMSPKGHGKRFQKAHNRTKAINRPSHMARGGIRL